MILVSRNIRYMQIFAGFLGEGASNNSVVVTTYRHCLTYIDTILCDVRNVYKQTDGTVVTISFCLLFSTRVRIISTSEFVSALPNTMFVFVQ